MLNIHKKKSNITPLSLYLLLLGLVWLLLIAARIAFGIYNSKAFLDAPAQDILKAFYIGCRFDGRLAAIITFPVGFCLTVAPLTRKLRANAGKIFFVNFCIFLLVWLVYAVDFGFYAYLGQRLNSTIIDLLADFSVSVRMVWASYPVVLSSIGLLAAVLLSAGLCCKFLSKDIQAYQGKIAKIAAWLVGFIVFGIVFFGQISSNIMPLRWSNAYFSPHPGVTALALNPLQNLYDTYRAIHDAEIDIEKTRKFYPLLVDFLQVDKPDAEKLHYLRHEQGAEQPKKPNVIIIVMESMAHTKSSFAPGQDDPTPFLKSLAEKSLYYSNFYANTRTTARAIFTTMTGIPDLTESSTGTRNQLVVDQRMIADQFTGYDKFYLLGGNAGWANLRGILGNNIRGLQIFEEGYWDAPNLDVWGVSDWDMLREAHNLFAVHTQNPFLAIIQTSTFHSPFSQPKNIPGFEQLKLSQETKDNYGFVSEAEYNGIRLADYSIAEFFRLARTASYYRNTIFVLFGDHGINDQGNNMNKSYATARLTPWQVPMLIHAPGLFAVGKLEPGVDARPASQIDVFPTLAYLAGVDYTNSTLGRNLLDARFKGSRVAFVSGQKDTPIRLIRDGFCYYDNKSGEAQSEHLFKLDDAEAADYKEADAERFADMKNLAQAIQETARYMLYNNKK